LEQLWSILSNFEQFWAILSSFFAPAWVISSNFEHFCRASLGHVEQFWTMFGNTIWHCRPWTAFKMCQLRLLWDIWLWLKKVADVNPTDLDPKTRSVIKHPEACRRKTHEHHMNIHEPILEPRPGDSWGEISIPLIYEAPWTAPILPLGGFGGGLAWEQSGNHYCSVWVITS
jgi:hypothetical protein